MTVTEGKQELIAFACVYYAKGMLDDKEYEALKIAINALKTIDWMRTEYEQALDLLEQDRAENRGLSVSNAYRDAKIGVYAKVLKDMEGVEKIDE